LASEATSLEALRAALDTFHACALRRTATNTVFADGKPDFGVMVIGEAPGADEDRMGLPFVGVSGKLLDAMLASIGLDRRLAYITNVVPWRPPGNRKPTGDEVALCLPFLERHVELVRPRVILAVGGLAAQSLLARTEGISRLRGQWKDYATPGLSRPVPVLATFHPAYLLRTPAQKRLAWRDMRALRARLDSFETPTLSSHPSPPNDSSG
jgi:DNA polymerase